MLLLPQAVLVSSDENAQPNSTQQQLDLRVLNLSTFDGYISHSEP